MDLRRGTFRVRGDILEVVPASTETIIRLSFFGDNIERISEHDILTGEDLQDLEEIRIFPAKHFVTTREKLDAAIGNIRKELEDRLKELKTEGKLLEMQRLQQRTNFDLEMMLNTG